MATRRWFGDAVDVSQVDTITVANTWATADTCTLTINGKDLVLTVGTDTTTAQVALAIQEMVSNTTQTGTGNHTFSETGDNIGEFAELTATVSGSVVTLTSDKGVPFTLAVVEVTAGSGTSVEATATAATGKNFFDNADNWSGTTVPVDDDDIVFDSGDVDLKYNIDQNGVTATSITIFQSYTGKIGLPETNSDNSSLTYREYRETDLKLGNSGDAQATTISIGEGEGSGSGRIRLNSGTGQAVLNVSNSGQRDETAVPAIRWVGTHASNVANILKGDVGVAIEDGEAATIATLRVGYLDNQAGDARVLCGTSTTLTTITQSGGTLQIDSAATTTNLIGGELTVLSGAQTTIEIDAGTVLYRGTGTITTARVGSDGVLDFRRDSQARTVTNCELHERGAIHDPFKTVTWTNGIDVTRSDLASVTLDLGTHMTITPSAI